MSNYILYDITNTLECIQPDDGTNNKSIFLKRKIERSTNKRIMTKKIELVGPIQDLILNPGEKFEVVEPQTDNAFLPGSIAYTSMIVHNSVSNKLSKNTAKLLVLTLRKGKKGKPRLQFDSVHCPIFYEKYTAIDERVTKNDCKQVSYYVIPSKLDTPLSLVNCAMEDFLGWSLSVTNYLRHLAKNGGVNSKDLKPVNFWPISKDHVLNQLIKLPDLWSEYGEEVFQKYENEDLRKEIIQNIRKIEASLYKRILEYKFRTIHLAKVSAENWLLNVAAADDFNTVSNACVSHTIIAYRKKSEKENTVAGQSKKSKKSAQTTDYDNTLAGTGEWAAFENISNAISAYNNEEDVPEYAEPEELQPEIGYAVFDADTNQITINTHGEDPTAIDLPPTENEPIEPLVEGNIGQQLPLSPPTIGTTKTYTDQQIGIVENEHTHEYNGWFTDLYTRDEDDADE